MPIKSRIRSIPDYPKKGILFRDITTLIKDPVGFRLVIDNLAQHYLQAGMDFANSSGFLAGFIPSNGKGLEIGVMVMMTGVKPLNPPCISSFN